MQIAGLDADWVEDWNSDPGDEAILARAFREGRILVTLDKDFGELAIRYGKPHHGILRLTSVAPEEQAQVCLDVLAEYAADLLAGAIVSAKVGKTKIRRPS